MSVRKLLFSEKIEVPDNFVSGAASVSSGAISEAKAKVSSFTSGISDKKDELFSSFKDLVSGGFLDTDKLTPDFAQRIARFLPTGIRDKVLSIADFVADKLMAGDLSGAFNSLDSLANVIDVTNEVDDLETTIEEVVDG